MDFDSQYLIVTADGRLWQAVRQGDGTWSSLRLVQLFARIGPATLDITSVIGLVAVGIGYPSAEVLIKVPSGVIGPILQTVIKEDGTASACTDVSAIVRGSVNIPDLGAGCVVDPFTSLYPFENQNQQLWILTHSTLNNGWNVEPGNSPNSVIAAAAAGASSAASQFLLATSDGSLLFTERLQADTWSGWVDVRQQFRDEGLPDPGPIAALAGACADFQSTAAGFTIQTQWLLIASNNFNYWYALRPFSQAPWTLYSLNARLGIPPPTLAGTNAVYGAGNGGTGSAFFCFTTADDGHLWWTKRLPDDTWIGVDPGTDKTDLSQMLAIPGKVIDVAITSQYAGIEPQ